MTTQARLRAEEVFTRLWLKIWEPSLGSVTMDEDRMRNLIKLEAQQRAAQFDGFRG